MGGIRDCAGARAGYLRGEEKKKKKVQQRDAGTVDFNLLVSGRDGFVLPVNFVEGMCCTCKRNRRLLLGIRDCWRNGGL